MATARLASGKIVEVPDGLNSEQARSYLLRNGATFEEVGLEPYPMDPMGAAERFGLGFGKFFADRIPGMQSGPEVPGLAGKLGEAAPAVVASLMVPGSGLTGILSQGALAGSLEAARKGSTVGSIGSQTLLAGAGTALGDMAGRVISGIGRAAKAARGGTYLDTTSEALRTVSSTAMGDRWIRNLNRKALASKAAASFGQQADNVGAEVLNKGAAELSERFRELVPKDAVIDLSDAVGALQQIDNLGPAVQRLIPKNPAAATGSEWQALRRAVAEKARYAIRDAPGSEMDWSLADDLIEEAAEKALGPGFTEPFRVVREQWKNLKLIEGLGSVKKGLDYFTPRELANRLGSPGGYGTSYMRDTGKVLPETQQLFDIARQAVKDAAAEAPNTMSGTRAAIAGGLAAAGSAVTGNPVPLGLFATGMGLGALGGVASVGRPMAAAGATGAITATQLGKALERESKE